MSELRLEDLKREDFVFASKATLGADGIQSSIMTRRVDEHGEPVYIHTTQSLAQIAALTGFDHLKSSFLVINFGNCEAPQHAPAGRYEKTSLPWMNEVGETFIIPVMENPLDVVLMAAKRAPSLSARGNAIQRSANARTAAPALQSA